MRARLRPDGGTPVLVLMAAQNGHSDALALLLSNGALAGTCMANRVSPLMCAAFGGHLHCAEQLLAAGADAGVAMTGDNPVLKAGPGTTALALAEREGHTEVAELLRAAAD